MCENLHRFIRNIFSLQKWVLIVWSPLHQPFICIKWEREEVVFNTVEQWNWRNKEWKTNVRLDWASNRWSSFHIHRFIFLFFYFFFTIFIQNIRCYCTFSYFDTFFFSYSRIFCSSIFFTEIFWRWKTVFIAQQSEANF